MSLMKKAEATRLMILQKAFELIYAKGCQATSIKSISQQPSDVYDFLQF